MDFALGQGLSGNVSGVVRDAKGEQVVMTVSMDAVLYLLIAGLVADFIWIGLTCGRL
jgi:hypothetical protein